MAQPQRLNPLLLSEGQSDEIAQLHQLGVAEVLVQPLPERIVRRVRIEDDGLGIGQRRLLPLVKLA